MDRMKQRITVVWTLVLTLALSTLLSSVGRQVSAIPQELPTALLEAEEFIVGWEGDVPEAFWSEVELIDSFPEIGAYTVKLQSDIERKEWLYTWLHAEQMKYIQPNHPVEILGKPNDPLYSKQSYLKQIGMEKAWDTVQSNTSIKIAVVDTGVDLYHPELSGRLAPGVNLVDAGAQPMDDNGHGTSVAGIIAAAGNNKQGTTGILWNTKIMPVKVMEADGSGDENKLGQGIRYAVENQAKIIVLSLGLYKYSPFLKDITQYAESSGVLLVAASGNDGDDIKYPAAYPTVMAVGGVSSSNGILAESSFGDELDLVAPYHVYSTALGGEYEQRSGTSMAAPQVAAAAALIWAEYPQLRPYQVRNLLKQTAQDIGDPGWDKRTGYGLLRVDQALVAEQAADIFEENETIQSAKRLRMSTMSTAVLSGGSDKDWYHIRSDYKGKVSLKLKTASPSYLSQIQVRVISAAGQTVHLFEDVTKPMSFSITYDMYVEVRAKNAKLNESIVYHLTPEFNIYSDQFENNDQQFKAYSMPARNMTIKGTFHQMNDVDWFVINVDQPGTLKLKLLPDTYRMDVAFSVAREGEKFDYRDFGNDGEGEYKTLEDVLPGKYYVKITNVTYSKDSYPVAGEYIFAVEYNQKVVDPNEPNDRSYQATKLTANYRYEGTIDPQNDVDYFEFSLKEKSYVKLNLSNIPTDRLMAMRVYDSSQNQLSMQLSDQKMSQLNFERVLNKGTYTIRLTSSQSFSNQTYYLKLSTAKMVGGFRDISGHWAEAYISDLSKRNIVNGYDNYQFKPNGQVTRAEAVVFFARALNLQKPTTIAFRDLSPTHWAYSSVSRAVEANLISGYPDASFKPNQPITRAEMSIMLMKSLNLKGKTASKKPFKDVSVSHWAAKAITELKSKDWVSGYEDGTYRPNANATRAEFSALIYRLVNEDA
ncbi:S8 family serine peptidase [Marinicrinis sediminis]|uniref:S8 family serine peptidase n=1 Tax=Marinicrinis sediminis TaxID=1652465 RepID=A0ABW5RAL8_9BACL